MVLRHVGAASQSERPIGPGDARVVTGGDGVEAERVGALEERTELDRSVALDARVRRAPGFVLAHVGLDDGVVEPLGEVEDVVRDVELRGDASGVLDIGHCSALKVFGSELNMEGYQLLMEILGPVSYLEPDAPGAVLKSRIQQGTRGAIILTFGGGVNEMQRDLISQFTLGFPRADR